MKICLLVHPYGEKTPSGLGRSIFEMVKGVVGHDPANFYTIYVKDKPNEKPDFPGTNWELKILGSKSLWLTGAWGIDSVFDLYIFFTPIIPLFFHPKKSIVVAHDFAYLTLSSGTTKERLVRWILSFLNARSFHLANQIIAVSHETKRSIIQHFKIDERKIVVIHNGFIPLPQASRSLPVPPLFFLFVGVIKARKNVSGIIQAFAIFSKSTTEDYQLLIAGKTEGPYYESLVLLVNELMISDKVKFLGYVSDMELAYLYKKAQAFVFPSLIEGFGMPILEAMDAGLPVITSSTGSLAEVAGDAALLVNPNQPKEIAKAMNQVAGNDSLRESLRQKGFTRVRHFTWEITAKKFLTIITQLEHLDNK